MSHAPEGYSPLSPVIISKDARALIKSYEEGLGAVIGGIMECPKTGKVGHACMRVGDASLFISDEFVEENKIATGRQEFYLYVENADEAYKKAQSFNFSADKEPEDMFWGDRVGSVKDIAGNTWTIAQKVRDVSMEEMEEAMKAMECAA